jgi:hypothetical protein
MSLRRSRTRKIAHPVARPLWDVIDGRTIAVMRDNRCALAYTYAHDKDGQQQSAVDRSQLRPDAKKTTGQLRRIVSTVFAQK